MTITGALENLKKSAYSLEYYDSSWELDYMKELEGDDSVSKWTKNHGIGIPYFDAESKLRTYKPDFLVEKTDGTIDLVEMTGRHLLKNPDKIKKMEFAKKWCEARGMKYRIVSEYQ